jgi:serine/threonine-protein kinase HipA
MELTVQIFVDDAWVDAATLEVVEPEKGSASPCKLGYDFDYALNLIDEFVNDERACSLLLPVELMEQHYQKHWFSFLEDIVPSGAARRILIRYFGLQQKNTAEQDIQLLKQGTIAPVGNLRIKESLPEIKEGSELEYRRYKASDVIERNADFLEYAQEMGAVSGGATGAAGEAPKLLLRLTNDDTVWIDTYQKSHDMPDRFYLVKFPRGRRTPDDCDVLRAEYHFYHELAAMGFDTIDTEGMRLEEGERYPSLWLPRFDVEWKDERWHRYGLESVTSALGKPAGSYLNHFDILNGLCELLSKRAPDFDCEEFVCEWVKRDLLNIAFGNSDNHGRNCALLKKPSSIGLAPIYDFAPMKADPEGVIRTTLWGSPYEEGGFYRWDRIVEQLDPLCPQDKLFAELQLTASKLVDLKERLQLRGVPERIINMPAMGFSSLNEKLKGWNLV